MATRRQPAGGHTLRAADEAPPPPPPPPPPSGLATALLAANLSAVAAGILTHPIDVTKVRMQLHGGGNLGRHFEPGPRPGAPGLLATASKIVSTEGAAGLFAGVSAAVLRSVLFIGTKFAAYDVLKERMAAVVGPPPPPSPKPPPKACSYPPEEPEPVVPGRTMNTDNSKGGLRADERDGRERDRRLLECKDPAAAPVFSSYSSSPSPSPSSPSSFSSPSFSSSPLPPPSNAELPLYAKLVCGLGAGLIGAVVGNPADLAMVRMQADGRIPKDSPLRRNYRNGGQALVHIARSEGIATLWRGCAPTTTRAMIVTASQMAIYDQTKQEIKARVPGMEEGLTLHTASSLVAGFVASVTSNPLDVAKTRMMNMQPGQYEGLGHCLAVTVRKEGATALYKGLSATMLRQVPLNVVRFSLMEQFKRLLKAQ